RRVSRAPCAASAGGARPPRPAPGGSPVGRAVVLDRPGGRLLPGAPAHRRRLHRALAADGRGAAAPRGGRTGTVAGRGARAGAAVADRQAQEPASKLLSPSNTRWSASRTVTSTSMPLRTLWVTVQKSSNFASTLSRPW